MNNKPLEELIYDAAIRSLEKAKKPLTEANIKLAIDIIIDSMRR